MRRTLSVAISLLVCLGTAAAVAGCEEVEPEPEGTFATMGEWVQRELAFTPLTPPGSTYAPGTIVSGSDTGALVVQADVADCFPGVEETVTEDEMAYSSAFAFSADVQGATNFISEITGAGSVSISAEAVKEVTVTFGAIKRWRIPVLTLSEAGKTSELSEACERMLWAYPVLAEMVALQDFQLAFRDEKGASVDVAAEQVEIDAEVQISEQGGLSVSNGKPMYVGFREMWLRMGCCVGEGDARLLVGACKEPPVPQPGEDCRCNSGVERPVPKGCVIEKSEADEIED